LHAGTGRDPIPAASSLPSPGGYDPAWFDRLAEVEQRHFWFCARNEVIAAAIRPLLPEIGPGPRVLEVGCGNGNVLQMLRRLCPDGTVVGMDLFAEGLEHARRRCDCRLVAGNILEPPFPAGAFDLVGIFDVLEHIDDDRRALRSLHFLTAPGGSVVLTVPAEPSLWSYFDEAGGHYRRYRRAELAGRLEEAGFTITLLSHFMLTLYPLVWTARRWTHRRFSMRTGGRNTVNQAELAARELKVRPLLNAVLRAALRWERAWIERRHTLPLGTSLLAVARKS
jgi:SAM-dependent methyltransferase